MVRAIAFQCSNCGETKDEDVLHYECPRCGRPLQIGYEIEQLDWNTIADRRVTGILKYREFMPVQPEFLVSMGEGDTPVVEAKRIGKLMGLRTLLIKNEAFSPTGSFKDRGSSLLASKARQLKMSTVAIDSSGNAAASLAGYSAHANLACKVFTPAYASESKLIQAQAYGASVIKVEGTRKDVYDTARAACAKHPWYYCGFQLNPYASEGLKTIAYEIFESFRSEMPDRIVFPVGTGSGLIGCWRGFKDLLNLALIDEIPSLVCVQPSGCSPIAKAFIRGSGIEPIEKPKTVAEGLMIGHPLKGETIIRALKETKGKAIAVDDERIIYWTHELGKAEGIYAEPSAAASVAGISKLVERGEIDSDERILCVITGSGLKTPHSLNGRLTKPLLIRPFEIEMIAS